MTTPKREMIIQRATEIWFQDQFKSGIMNPTNPETEELKECGAWAQAISELMYSNATKHEIEKWESYSEQTESDFNFDTKEAMQTTTFISGSRGTGKSDTAMYAVDRLKKEGIVCVVFDSSLDWVHRSSISRFVTVHPYTVLEVPNESTIFDISLLTPMEQQRIIESFCKSLFEFQLTNDKRFYVVFEEAQIYFPLNSLRSKKTQNSMRILTVGRNLNISLLCVSQFPSLIDKEVVKNAQQIYIGCTSEPNTLSYWRQLLGKKQTKKLKKLQNGEFLYYCRNKIDKIEIQPYENSSVKKQIVVPETKLIEPIKPLPNTQTNYTLAKALIIGFLGLIWLWLSIGGH